MSELDSYTDSPYIDPFLVEMEMDEFLMERAGEYTNRIWLLLAKNLKLRKDLTALEAVYCAKFPPDGAEIGLGYYSKLDDLLYEERAPIINAKVGVRFPLLSIQPRNIGQCHGPNGL